MPIKKIIEEDFIKNKNLKNRSTFHANQLRRDKGGFENFLRFLVF